MSMQISTREAHRVINQAETLLEKAMTKTAENPRDAGTLNPAEFQSAIGGNRSIPKAVRNLAEQIFVRAQKTVDGQVGADDLREVAGGYKAAVTSMAPGFGRSEATTKGLRMVYAAAVSRDNQ